MKDSLESILKRAARAILAPELKALRKELRDTKANSAAKIAEAQSEARWAKQASERNAVLAHGYSSRTAQVLAWAQANRPGDMGLQACAEYIEHASMASQGIGGTHQYLNPFDRWQVKPAIRTSEEWAKSEEERRRRAVYASAR